MNDILVILMVAFGLFTIVMFILFYVYLRKHYNSKHLEEDYEKLGEEENDFEQDTEEIAPVKTLPSEDNDPYDGDFVPIRKK